MSVWVGCIMALFIVMFLLGLQTGYGRAEAGKTIWGRDRVPPEFVAERIIDGRLYSTAAARRIGTHRESFLYLTSGGEFFWVAAAQGERVKMEVMARYRAREWVQNYLPAREGRAVLEEWFGERIELA